MRRKDPGRPFWFGSTDNGASWTAVNNGLTATNVSALAVSDMRAFAGTDERRSIPLNRRLLLDGGRQRLCEPEHAHAGGERHKLVRRDGG